MVRVILFAALKDIVGVGSLDVKLSAQDTTAQEVWTSLVNTYPDLERYQESVQVAVNQKHVDRDMTISNGDEIAFFPPVSGGVQ
jgi:molybdopterin synthase sulfur carrier subunit